ncbi:hypothetical protein [Hymenobacter glacieicola]|uniref:Outer membrane protein beta-barrel domain-containing protein n=1 Tax=Hymenobacter glacieicola TaxID=1562124 RepID=A0ABQ1WYM9_9BACT|nr:hypothetical protein [Hymenobacter glacieicola]GGG51228.1 hypothetical protein GCM10011378_29300 [Hymenobacter glacieicola]
MKRLLFLLLMGGASLGLAPTVSAQVTDTTRTVKPQLNTAPPGSAPAPARTPPPVYQPTPTPPTEPVQPGVPASNAPFDPNRPSGLDLPQRPGVAAPELPMRRYFLYSNFGLGFSSLYGFNQFSASLAPAIGYRVSKRFAIGPGISYAYNSYSARGYESIKTNSLGLKGFAQFIVFDQFFLHGEYEVTKAEVLYQDQSTGQLFKGDLTVKTPLAGAGYRQQIGDRAAADIVVLYNFNDGINDIYGQPVIRFSFLFDLK